jgi:hypothetical protein
VELRKRIKIKGIKPPNDYEIKALSLSTPKTNSSPKNIMREYSSTVALSL